MTVRPNSSHRFQIRWDPCYSSNISLSIFDAKKLMLSMFPFIYWTVIENSDSQWRQVPFLLLDQSVTRKRWRRENFSFVFFYSTKILKVNMNILCRQKHATLPRIVNNPSLFLGGWMVFILRLAVWIVVHMAMIK